MVSVGIKELKAKLSSYVDIASRGEEVVITEHNREVAVIIPISRERKAIKSLMDSGRIKWAGGKPAGAGDIKIKGKSLSKTVLEERR